VTYAPEAILIDVRNPADAREAGRGSGYGLIGMRERATAAGGTVTAGLHEDGRFAVHADLPAPGEVSS
jgi:signal transduction histidine kinase